MDEAFVVHDSNYVMTASIPLVSRTRRQRPVGTHNSNHLPGDDPRIRPPHRSEPMASCSLNGVRACLYVRATGDEVKGSPADSPRHCSSLVFNHTAREPPCFRLDIFAHNIDSIEREDYGIVRFTVPDTSISSSERALYTLPGKESVHDTRVKLHDFTSAHVRSENAVLAGRTGLDRQGFAYVKYTSSLHYDDWCKGSNIEGFYVPETEDLGRAVTGCRKVVVYCVSFRRRLPQEQGVEKVERRGGETDAIGCLPRDRCLSGKLTSLVGCAIFDN